jgi:predicted metal-dependent hydrolase
MVEIVQIGSPPIEVHLRRSTRARRFSLRISNTSGVVSLTLPKRASARAALSFAADNEGWLRQNLQKRPEQVVPVFGGMLLLDGTEVLLQQGRRRSPVLDKGTLAVAGQEEALGARLRGFLKTRARDRFSVAAQSYAQQLGQEVSRITLRDTRTRWGSCTSDGNLMFSWRLAMAPVPVQNYVAAHEVCHLIEMNHSPAYWRLVEQIFPDYKSQQNWLKTNGSLLHRYIF